MKQKLLMTSATFYTDVSLAMSFCAKIMREDTRGVRTYLREDVSETVREAVAETEINIASCDSAASTSLEAIAIIITGTYVNSSRAVSLCGVLYFALGV